VRQQRFLEWLWPRRLRRRKAKARWIRSWAVGSWDSRESGEAARLRQWYSAPGRGRVRDGVHGG